MNCLLGQSSAVDKYLKSGRRISSDETGKTVDLSSEDLRIIKKSWAGIKNKKALGQKIFYLIFINKPELKPLFKIHTDNPVELMQHPFLLRHADVFVDFLQTIVSELYEEDPLSQNLVNVVRAAGLAHCGVRSMSFTAENWLVFKSTICEVMGKTETANGKAYMAWAKLLTFVISEMKDAYLYGVRRNTWPGTETEPENLSVPSSSDSPASPASVVSSSTESTDSLPKCPYRQ